MSKLNISIERIREGRYSNNSKFRFFDLSLNDMIIKNCSVIIKNSKKYFKFPRQQVANRWIETVEVNQDDKVIIAKKVYELLGC